MAIQITNAQLEKLKPYALDNYIIELVDHCDEYYPHLRRTLGEDKLKETLKQGIEKAKQNGFIQRGPVRFYIDMMIVFGSDFQTDPQYPWIRETLTKNKELSQLDSTSILYQQVEDYLSCITGDQECYLRKAVAQLQMLTLDTLNVYRENYIQHVHALLYRIYPEKYQQTGEEDITVLIKHATRKAELEYRLVKAEHVAVIVLLAFLLGHKFDQDIFYQWINKEKLEQYVANHDLFINKIISRAKIWLAAAIKANWNNELA